MWKQYCRCQVPSNFMDQFCKLQHDCLSWQPSTEPIFLLQRALGVPDRGLSGVEGNRILHHLIENYFQVLPNMILLEEQQIARMPLEKATGMKQTAKRMPIWPAWSNKPLPKEDACQKGWKYQASRSKQHASKKWKSEGKNHVKLCVR